MIPDSFMSYSERKAVFDDRFFLQEGCESFIEAFPHDLVYQPHDL